MRQGVLLTVAYDGTAYSGIAPQKTVTTVGQALLQAIRHMEPEVSRLRVTSRTDAGVHARRQLVCFDTNKNIEPRGWTLGLAAHLPDDISVRRCCIVPERFDPRGWVVGKWYQYIILQDQLRDPFVHNFAWKIRWEFDDALAQRAAKQLVGTHDFAAFRSSADSRDMTIRNLFDVTVSRHPIDSRQIFVDVRGNAFLHNMVRIIAGSLVDIARGHLSPSVFSQAFASRSRADLGLTAPAHGLTLQQIVLAPSSPLLKCWPIQPQAALDDTWPGWADRIATYSPSEPPQD